MGEDRIPRKAYHMYDLQMGEDRIPRKAYHMYDLQMGEDRIPRKAYNMLYDLDAKGKKNWVSNIRVYLFEYGFGFVWINQRVGIVHDFICAFRQRLIDCSWQRWNDHIQSSE
eukprot:TRINITY_DN71147_c0_g1_i4.p1 TRINITY_DN71147_c0_g1~~TRINITY_DN71147_c0_g1_i4.p1  ORF type:complete len:112 (-),score=1.98 TRINITY_DN71147_c0_g1_i4:112-447(-)